MKIIDCIFCDDIREEKSNKKILIGVYEERLIMNVPENTPAIWPQPLKIASLIRVKINKGDPIPTDLNYQLLHNEKHILEVKGAINLLTPQLDHAEKDGILSFVFLFNLIEIPSVGLLSSKLVLFRQGKQVFKVTPECTLSIEIALPPQN